MLKFLKGCHLKNYCFSLTKRFNNSAMRNYVFEYKKIH